MFSFAYGFDDAIEIKGTEYNLNLSYDNVLRLFDLLADGSMTDYLRFSIAFQMLFGEQALCDELSIDQQFEIIQTIIRTYIVLEKPSVVLASMQEDREKQKEYYSLIEDADIIFASFFYDYNIDLLEERGRLHWRKFKALLNNLSEHTKLSKVIEIRQWKPTEHSTPEEKEQMRQLQKYYSLDVTQKDAEELMYFNSLSGEEKEAFARRRLEEMELGGG